MEENASLRRGIGMHNNDMNTFLYVTLKEQKYEKSVVMQRFRLVQLYGSVDNLRAAPNSDPLWIMLFISAVSTGDRPIISILASDVCVGISRYQSKTKKQLN